MAPSVVSSTVAAASELPVASDARPHDSSLPQGEGAVRKNQQQLKCPRCGSNNTKFCYYNNYSTAQPRHFCRVCRRYWTHGGTLRDVPVGGASRRNGNKRRRISGEPSSASPLPSALLDAYPDVPAFPFVSDGIYLPQFDHGVAPAAFALPSVVPGYFDGLTPWEDGTYVIGNAGASRAWDDIADIELSWPPPGN